MKNWCTASLYSHFFSCIWRMQNIWFVVDLLCRNPHWWSSIISSAYGVTLDSRMLDKILYTVDNSDNYIITTVCFIALLINRYNDWLPPLLRHLLLIPNWINKCMDLRVNCSPSCFNQFCWDLMNTSWFVLFCFSIAISISKALASGTSDSAVCISVCLTSLMPCTFNNWQKWFLHVAKII